ncbi:CDP-glycerol glycerophosphotransferase family protein [Pediococcus acidilactici]
MKKFYLLLVRLVDWLFQRRPARFKIAYFMSFTGNTKFIKQLTAHFGKYAVLLVYEPAVNTEVQRLKKAGVVCHTLEFRKFQITSFVRGIRAARVALFDNYYPELSAVAKLKEQYFIQIWHANGAIKAFGWEDPSTYHRSPADQQRFQQVYDSFDEIVVGSAKMAEVFQRSWKVGPAKLAEIGYPRSDQYFDEDWVKKARTKVFQYHPRFKKQRVILYAPTYRKDVTFKLPANWSQLEVPEDAVLVVRLHPHLSELEQQLVANSPARVVKVDRRVTTQELLCVADTVITDYSSIAFDFSLLDNANAVIFFTYDFAQFEQTVGIQASFKQMFFNELIGDVAELNAALQNHHSSKNSLRKINQQWNELNDGHAGTRLIQQIEGILTNA